MDLLTEKLLDMLYMEIVENIDDEVCVNCPIVRAIRDLKDTLRHENSDRLIVELGLSFRAMDCPCSRKEVSRSE
jgi:hypothetical protein